MRTITTTELQMVAGGTSLAAGLASMYAGATIFTSLAYLGAGQSVGKAFGFALIAPATSLMGSLSGASIYSSLTACSAHEEVSIVSTPVADVIAEEIATGDSI